MVTTQILIGICAAAILVSLFASAYLLMLRQTRTEERIDELQERFLMLEKYICGADGHFEDSIHNGSSMNGILNAIIIEVAKLNPNGWKVTTKTPNDEKFSIVEEHISPVVNKKQDKSADDADNYQNTI